MFDDPSTAGMIVLLKRRRDGHFDICRQSGLALDPALAQVGGELGEWRQASIDPARFDVSQDGIDVDVRLVDLAGREIRVRIDDRDGRRRRRGYRWPRSGRPSNARSRCRCSSWAAVTSFAAAPEPLRSASTAASSRPGACPVPGCTGAGWSSTPPTPPWSCQPRPRRAHRHRREPGRRHRRPASQRRRPPGPARARGAGEPAAPERRPTPGPASARPGRLASEPGLGRDELETGEMWTSNSVIAWLLARSGLPTDAIRPPAGGSAPGRTAGLAVAHRWQSGGRPRPARDAAAIRTRTG